MVGGVTDMGTVLGRGSGTTHGNLAMLGISCMVGLFSSLKGVGDRIVGSFVYTVLETPKGWFGPWKACLGWGSLP